MPREPLITGFFGKIPAASDFVSWNLPRIFTDRWDRWMSMELQARPDEGELDPRIWRFIVRGGIFGELPASGAWCMSEDRAGRRFPFVVAGLGPVPNASDPWFNDVARIVEGAVRDASSREWVTMETEHLGQPDSSADERIAFWLDDWEVQEASFIDIHDLAANGLPAMRGERPEIEEP